MADAFRILNVDIQLMILDWLSEKSPKTLLNVALSSRSLYSLSKSLIYRVISFTFNRRRRDVNGRLIKQLLADHDLSTKVREIRILWAPSANLQPGEGSKEDLELLGQALPLLTGLKAFVWDAQYPILSWLLHTLQTHQPQCLLYTRHPARQDSVQTLPRLCGSPCLFSLDVTITTGQFQAFNELQKVLNSTPNLRDLTITSDMSSSHVSPYMEQREREPLLLRSLELYGRMFDTFELPVAWPLLERLSLESQSYLLNVLPDFTGLKSLKLRIGDADNSTPLSVALQECKRLEVLDLTGFVRSIQSANEKFWENCGKSLIKLRLHEEETLYRFGQRATLSFADIECIAKHCRNLRSLGLDLQCNGKEWPHDSLRNIADHLWFIVHLELNILIENPQRDHPTSPKATIDSVPEIWTYLWQQILSFRVHQGHNITTPRLRSLDLIAGSRKPASDPSLQYWQADQQRFSFDVSDRDDEAHLGVANAVCTELEALLSKLSSAGPLWNHQQELIMKFATQRAREGPHIKMPSVMDSEMVRPSPFWDKLDEDRFSYRCVANRY